jgi:predicted CXXCH cytochrome family protein
MRIERSMEGEDLAKGRGAHPLILSTEQSKTLQIVPHAMLPAVLLILAIIPGFPTAAWGQTTKLEGAELCYTCHAELKAKFSQGEVHAPVKMGQCDLCHSPHAARFPKLLRFKGADLCYVCHADKKETFTSKTAHTPVKRGQCLNCHDPHASPNKNLLAKAGADLCLSCHQKVKNAPRKVKHMPFESGDCLQCHQAHTSPVKNLLLKPAAQLCQECHQVSDPRIARVHQPFNIATASCVSCHAPHGSDNKGLIKTVEHEPFAQGRCSTCHQVSGPDPKVTFLMGAELCLTCHSKEAQAFKKKLVHAPVTAGQCLGCHTPHASEFKGLLVGEERETCLGCHAPVQDKFSRSKAFHPASAGDGRCTICHTAHASDQPWLFPKDSLQTCSTCHETHASLSHPMGPGVTDPRTKGSLTCLSCHDPHGTQVDNFLTFSKERELCIQCHRGELLRTRQ